MYKLTRLLPLIPLAAGIAQTPPAAVKPAAPKAAAVKTPAAKPSPPKAPVVKAPAAKPADPTARVVLTVGAEKVTIADFERLVDAMPEQFRTQIRGAGKRQFLEQLIQIKALSQEARRRKIDQTPGYLAQMAFQRENLLAQALYKTFTPT